MKYVYKNTCKCSYFLLSFFPLISYFYLIRTPNIVKWLEEYNLRIRIVEV